MPVAHAPARTAVVYNEAVVRKFTIAAMFWAVVAFLVGVVIAAQLAWPQLNLGLSFTNFGRLRPVHTSAAIFAFGLIRRHFDKAELRQKALRGEADHV
ncbi:MAG: cbb3-type cytochrome c oxidase subunit I [Rhodospirillales bacterium]|nr:cbb3-type cytochrome c oxidase subunit I [Rhodospirillales bacterium]